MKSGLLREQQALSSLSPYIICVYLCVHICVCMCIYIQYLCVCVYTHIHTHFMLMRICLHAWYLQRLDQGIRSPGIIVTMVVSHYAGIVN